MKKVGVFLVILILFSVSVSAFDFFGLFGYSEPVITGTQANPIKVYPGQSLQNLVSFEDKYGIESAVAYFPYEGGYDKVEMILTAGNSKKGTYSATWVVHDTLNMKWYATKVVLINEHGERAIAEVEWQDPTQDHPAEQVRPGIFQTGYYSFNGTGSRVAIGRTNPLYPLHIENSVGGGMGIFSFAYGSSGVGIQGYTNQSPGFGVIGRSVATSGVTQGIRGQVSSPDGYAGYFQGGKGVYMSRGPTLLFKYTTDNVGHEYVTLGSHHFCALSYMKKRSSSTTSGASYCEVYNVSGTPGSYSWELHRHGDANNDARCGAVCYDFS